MNSDWTRKLRQIEIKNVQSGGEDVLTGQAGGEMGGNLSRCTWNNINR